MKAQFRILGCIAFLILGLTSNVGAQWIKIQLSSPGAVHCIAEIGENMFAGTDSGVLRSSDGGSNWIPVNNGLPNVAIQALAGVGSNLFAGTRGRGIFGSADSGSNWTPKNDGIDSESNVDAIILSDADVIAGTLGHGIYTSGDSGRTWRSYNAGLTDSNVCSLVHASGQTPFVGTLGGEVFFLQSSAWFLTNIGLPHAPMRAFAVTWNARDGSNLFVGTDGGIYRSNFVTNVWTWPNVGLGNTQVYSFASTSNALYAGTDSGVFLSLDNSKSWASASAGLPKTTITSLMITGNNLLAGTTNNGIWKCSLAELQVDKRSVERRSYLSIYPNPFSDRTTIKVTSIEQGVAEISVINILGERVAQLYKGELNAGEHVFNWDATGLPAGMYVCVVQSGEALRHLPILLSR